MIPKLLTPAEMMADSAEWRSTAPGPPTPLHVQGPAHVIPGAVDAQWCADALEVYARRNDWEPSTQRPGTSLVGLTADLNTHEPFLWTAVTEIKRHLEELDRECWGLKNLIVSHAHVLRYTSGSRFAWHRDGALDDRRRWIGVVVMLSDPDSYEGGTLVIKDQGSHRPEPGTLVLLPGDCWHEVTEVTAGVRQVLTIFICTPEVEAT